MTSAADALSKSRLASNPDVDAPLPAVGAYQNVDADENFLNASPDIGIQYYHEKSKEPEGYNEIRAFRKARWWCPPQAAWKIFGFTTYHQQPSVERLIVHLEDEKLCRIPDRPLFKEDAPGVLKSAAAQYAGSQLMQWFALNRAERRLSVKAYPTRTAANELLYTEISRHYVWISAGGKKFWRRRMRDIVQFPTEARMYTVHPKDAERYFLRLLLCHVRGVTCHEDVRTYEGTLFATYRETCLARRLLADDKEWSHCLREGATYQSGKQLRDLIVFLFKECDPADPKGLFEEFAEDLSDDLIDAHKTRSQIEAGKQERYYEALHLIERNMDEYGGRFDASFFTVAYCDWCARKKVDHDQAERTN